MRVPNLRIMLKSIPPHVTLINLQNNKLFKNETYTKIDAFLIELGDIRVRQRLNLSHNGTLESALALAPLIQMNTSGIPIMRRTEADYILKSYNLHAPQIRIDELTLPPEMVTHIASFVSSSPEQKTYTAINKISTIVATRKIHDDWFASQTQFAPDISAISLTLSTMILLAYSYAAMLTLSARLMILSAVSASINIYDFACSLPGSEAFELPVTLPLLKTMSIITDVTPPLHTKETISYLNDDGEERSTEEPRATNNKNTFFLDEPGHGRCFGEDAMHTDRQLFSSHGTLLY